MSGFEISFVDLLVIGLVFAGVFVITTMMFKVHDDIDNKD